MPFNYDGYKPKAVIEHRCRHCYKPFVSTSARFRHERSHGRNRKLRAFCGGCGEGYFNHASCKMHERTCSSMPQAFHQQDDNPTPEDQIGFGANGTGNRIPQLEPDGELEEVESTLAHVARSFMLNFNRHNQLEIFARLRAALFNQIYERLQRLQQLGRPVKFQLKLRADFFSISTPSKITAEPPFFLSEMVVLLASTNILEVLDILYPAFLHQLDNYEGRDSGWALLSLVSLQLDIIKFIPLRGSSWFATEDEIEKRKATLNIRNMDNKCFLDVVLAAVHPVAQNKNLSSNYRKYEHELNMDGIEYPVSLNDIDKFERQNPQYSINVFGYTDERYHIPQAKRKNNKKNGKNNKKEKMKVIFPLRISEKKKERHVNMLYWQNAAGETHYLLITSMSRLLSKQFSRHKCAKFICDRCLHACTSPEVLERHEKSCKLQRPQLTIMPDKGEILEFKEFRHQFKLPFSIYADCETIQENEKTVHPSMEKSSTTKTANQIPASVCYKVVSTDPTYYSAPRLFRGKDCIVQFLDALKHDISKIKEHLKRTLEMNLTEEENATFLASTKCHICGDGEKSNDPFVRDHCHLTGRFRGAAHNSCNLNYGLCPDKVKIPVFFHNLRGFDSHLILKYVKPKQHGSIKCIPKNGEQVISMSIGSAVFKDSAAFLSGSLEKLIESLPKNHMILTRQFLEQMELNAHLLSTRNL